MKSFILILLWLFVSLSCSTNTEPIGIVSSDYNVYIAPTGKTDNGYIEFKFTNISENILHYTGYNENSPFYMIQVKNDTGWVNSLGWCGTGAKIYNFYPGQYFKVNIYQRTDNKLWRVGIYTTSNMELAGEYSWSDVQN